MHAESPTRSTSTKPAAGTLASCVALLVYAASGAPIASAQSVSPLPAAAVGDGRPTSGDMRPAAATPASAAATPDDATATGSGDSPWTWTSTAQLPEPGAAADLAQAAPRASGDAAAEPVGDAADVSEPEPAAPPSAAPRATTPPTAVDPAVTDAAAMDDPAGTDPALLDPAAVDPAATEPAGGLAVVEPAAAAPAVAAPAPDLPASEPVPLPSQGVLFRVLPPATAPDTSADPTQPPPAPSYLFGTIHFGSDAELGLDPAMLAAVLAPASTLVGEVDVDAVPDPALDPYRWLPDTQPLSSLIDADAWAMARHLLPDVAPATLRRMKPWVVLALVEARGEPLGEGSLDVRLQRLAQARGLPLVQLETLEDQLRALDCVPSDAQAQVLQERLKTPWVLREMSQRALAHYRGRDLGAWLADIDRMPGLGDAARAIEQQARRCLIEDRNARWMPALLALIATGGCTVAVGAIHLPGKDGLLAALARAGYRIEAQPL